MANIISVVRRLRTEKLYRLFSFDTRYKKTTKDSGGSGAFAANKFEKFRKNPTNSGCLWNEGALSVLPRLRIEKNISPSSHLIHDTKKPTNDSGGSGFFAPNKFEKNPTNFRLIVVVCEIRVLSLWCESFAPKKIYRLFSFDTRYKKPTIDSGGKGTFAPKNSKKIRQISDSIVWHFICSLKVNLDQCTLRTISC